MEEPVSYQGHIERGMVVFDEPISLPEGTEVVVEPVAPPRERAPRTRIFCASLQLKNSLPSSKCPPSGAGTTSSAKAKRCGKTTDNSTSFCEMFMTAVAKGFRRERDRPRYMTVGNAQRCQPLGNYSRLERRVATAVALARTLPIQRFLHVDWQFLSVVNPRPAAPNKSACGREPRTQLRCDSQSLRRYALRRRIRCRCRRSGKRSSYPADMPWLRTGRSLPGKLRKYAS